jgi:uncharacterized protein
MARSIRALALAGVALLGLTAGAAAQNHPGWCDEQASLNAAERAVCRTRSLWVLDDVLNGAYQRALRAVGSGQAGELRRSQQDWVRVARNGCGPDVVCLTAVYERRIEVLEAIARRGSL